MMFKIKFLAFLFTLLFLQNGIAQESFNYKNGTFKNTTGKTWIEKNSDGEFTWVEYDRVTNQQIYMKRGSYELKVSLLDKKIYLKAGNGSLNFWSSLTNYSASKVYNQTSLEKFSYSKGTFTNTSGKTWQEKNGDGEFNWTEYERVANSHIFMERSGYKLKVSLLEEKVYIKAGNGTFNFWFAISKYSEGSIRKVFSPSGKEIFSYRYKKTYQTYGTDCSTPDWLNLLDITTATNKYNTHFLPACHNHDLDYKAPWRLAGFSGYEGKNVVDNNFHKDMVEICKDLHTNETEESWCRTVAFFWYKAVKLKGHNAFDNGQIVSKNDVDPSSIRNTGYRGKSFTWSVEIDACHGDLSNTYTSNKVSIDFFEGNTLIETVALDGVDDGCTLFKKDPVFSITTDRAITSVKLRTNGNDAFFIDALKLLKDNHLINHYGRNGGNGWCLSTDANDSNGPWKDNLSSGGCQSSFFFPFKREIKEREWSVIIDACHSGLKDTGTDNTITTEFWADNELAGSVKEEGPPSGCSNFVKDTKFELITNKWITKIIVKTNGSDNYFIDKLDILQDDELNNSHGGDGGNGWCLSTNNLTSGTWSKNLADGTCQSAWSFDLSH